MNPERLVAIALATLLATAGTAAATTTSIDSTTEANASLHVDAAYDDGAVTLTLTRDGDPVENASVGIEGERVGVTDADGTITVDLGEVSADGALSGVDDGVDVTIRTEDVSIETTYALENGDLVRENVRVSAAASGDVSAGGGDASVDASASAESRSETDGTDDSDRAAESGDATDANGSVSVAVDADANVTGRADASADVAASAVANASTNGSASAAARATANGTADAGSRGGGGAAANASADGNSDAAAGVDADASTRGPPVDLPAQVPDHVSQVHDLVRSFLSGDDDGGNLGDVVGDLLGGGANAEGSASAEGRAGA
jgi:hypothetical protein